MRLALLTRPVMCRLVAGTVRLVVLLTELPSGACPQLNDGVGQTRPLSSVPIDRAQQLHRCKFMRNTTLDGGVSCFSRASLPKRENRRNQSRHSPSLLQDWPFQNDSSALSLMTMRYRPAETARVFLSVGRVARAEQKIFLESLEGKLRAHGLEPRTIGRNTFTFGQPLERIKQTMHECRGLLVLAFERTRVASGMELQPDGGTAGGA